MRFRPQHAAAAGLLALAVAGCGDKSPVTPIALPPLSAVTVAPVADTLRVGESATFSATAWDTLGAIVGGATFKWTSLADSIFTVNSFGRVRGVSEGSGLLVVEAGGKRDTAQVMILPVPTGWYTQASSANSANLHSVFFQPDGLHGWAVGDAGKIVYTDDAGATWTPQVSLTAFSLYGVWFATSQEGYAVGVNGTVLHTRNGGARWDRDSSGTAETLRDVHFATRDTGWAVGTNGIILRTFDRGASWQKTFPTSATLRSVSFADTRDGWAVGDGVIAGTHDGGRSWFLVQPAVTSQSLKAVWRNSEALAVAVGDQGSAPRTFSAPDSTTWSLQSAGSSYQLEGVHFPTDEVGYAVGYSGNGAVLRARPDPMDPLVSLLWDAQTSNTQFRLNGVFFVDENRGWAVGDQGTIIHTATGGNP